MFDFLMIGIRKNYQVFNSIVKAISIYVVNMFPSFQFSSQMLLHQISMFPNRFSINFNVFINSFWFTKVFKSIYFYVLRQFVFCKTRPRTIFNFPKSNSIRRNVKTFFTKNAIKFRSSFFSSLQNSSFKEMRRLARTTAIYLLCFFCNIQLIAIRTVFCSIFSSYRSRNRRRTFVATKKSFSASFINAREFSFTKFTFLHNFRLIYSYINCNSLVA